MRFGPILRTSPLPLALRYAFWAGFALWKRQWRKNSPFCASGVSAGNASNTKTPISVHLAFPLAGVFAVNRE